MDLHHIVYLSSAWEGFDRSELDELARIANAKNTEHGLTGLLLYSGTHFIQVLEGSRDDLDTVFEKIRRDPRHTNIEVLFDTPIRARSFDNWGMGVLDLSDRVDLDRSVFRFIARQARGEPAVSGRAALAALNRFKQELSASRSNAA